jgi:hypothetical protein
MGKSLRWGGVQCTWPSLETILLDLRRQPTINGLIDYDQFCGIQPAPVEPVGNPNEVTVQDMKRPWII